VRTALLVTGTPGVVLLRRDHLLAVAGPRIEGICGFILDAFLHSSETQQMGSYAAYTWCVSICDIMDQLLSIWAY
jgi:hypothetical protein